MKLEEIINRFVDGANISVLTHFQHIIFSVRHFASLCIEILCDSINKLKTTRRKKAIFSGQVLLKILWSERAKGRDLQSRTLRGWHFPYDTYKKLSCNKMVYLTKRLKIIVLFSSHCLRSLRDLSTKNSGIKQNPINRKGMFALLLCRNLRKGRF